MRSTRVDLILATALLLGASVAVADELAMAIAAGDNQEGQPGKSLETPPEVVVTSAGGLPQQGVDVEFFILEGGGLISGAFQTTGSDGTAVVGSWVLGDYPGPKRLGARLADEPDTNVEFNAIAVGETALEVTLTVNDTIIAGDPFLYTAKVTNEGPYTAESVQVAMVFDDLIEPESIEWSCESGGGTATCSPSGSGGLQDTADLPSLGQVTYTVASAVPINLISGQVTSSVSIEPPEWIDVPDDDTLQSQATAEIEPNPAPIFTDRFEQQDD